MTAAAAISYRPLTDTDLDALAEVSVCLHLPGEQ